MSQFYSKIDHYKNVMQDLGIDCDAQLLTAVTKGLGPSIYKPDAETVSGTSENELFTIRMSFLRKKLGVFDSNRIDAAIEKVIHRMGGSSKNKYRAIFYYLLVKELEREHVYE